MKVRNSIDLFIGGRTVAATSGETFTSVNPATGEVLAEVGVTSAADVDRAVAAAREGFTIWSATTGAERSRVLLRAAAILRERNDDLARLEVRDTGKPIAEALTVDVASGADCLEFFAAAGATLHGEYHDLGGAFAYTRREPLGVCAGIGAWNYPIQIACWKSAPALASGNAMVFKPSELTPLTAMELAAIYTEAGLPAGVFNVVHGGGAVGAALATHPGIAKISLTGSVPTGRRVMAASSETVKAVTLELGGKSPLLVFPDADLDQAVAGALLANFSTQGEICSNGTRVFVHRDVHDRFLDALRTRTEKLVVGDPMDPDTDVGALISEAHLQKVLGYIDAGIAAGARVVCGGRRATGTEFLDGGCFVEPTIFSGCTDDMAIVRDEIFGPVMSVLAFDTEDEAVARANGTEYGLAAGLFTRDVARAHRVAAALEAGIVWVNTYNLTPIEVPFGGVKQSGIGRENGVAALEHFTQRKTVYVETGTLDTPYA